MDSLTLIIRRGTSIIAITFVKPSKPAAEQPVDPRSSGRIGTHKERDVRKDGGHAGCSSKAARAPAGPAALDLEKGNKRPSQSEAELHQTQRQGGDGNKGSQLPLALTVLYVLHPLF